ncbi:MAG: S8 family serine peptidase [Candidatus Kaistia colombiensis]|nr:MAG: S8 family serine peptidase [Kaistia sp.]
MNTHQIGWIALCSILLATAPTAQVFATERFSVAQAYPDEGSSGEDWRRQKRPSRSRYPQPGPVILIAPILEAIPDREIAPPYDDEGPAPRRVRPRSQQADRQQASNPKSAKPKSAKPRQAKKKSPELKQVAAIPRATDGSFVDGEVLFSAPSPEITDAILKRYRLTRLETAELALTGTTVVRARVARGDDSRRLLRALRADKSLLSSELNHLYALQAEAVGSAKGDLAAAQYAPAKMRLDEAHVLADGSTVLVAIIDSGVDGRHPELAGTLDPASLATTIGPHGTAIAGVIAAHQRLAGVSPQARIVAFDSFLGPEGATARGSTLDILKSLDKAAAAGARIVNLSFAGPEDVLLARGLAAAHQRGMILIAAAGNGGPKAAPAYPAAHPAVIAVTATGPDDAIYPASNRGAYVALAAPGVDILTAAPGETYAQLSGTSLAAAQVSGVVALLLQHAPELSPEQVRAILTRTARDLGRPGRDDIFGAGLVDAAAALLAVDEATANAALR